MAQARVARSGVIDGKLHIAEHLDRLAEGRVVLDRDVFGELEDQLPIGRPDHLSEPMAAIEDETGRHVEGEESLFGQVWSRRERRLDRGELVVVPEPNGSSLDEPQVWPGAIGEPC